MSDAAGTEAFPLREARKIVKDLHTPKAHIYWVDFLCSVSVGWASIYVAATSAIFSGVQIAALIVATIAMYRAVLFIHELSHFKRGTFGLFRAVWNLLCGFPLLVPSFTYAGVHIDHHKPQIYGTKEDGEYLPIGLEAPWKLSLYILASVFPPAALAIRFIIVTPLSYLHPKFRALVWRYASSLTVDLTYARPESTKANDRHWQLQETCAFLYGTAALAAWYFGYLPVEFLAVWYVTTMLVLLLNTVRTFVAHAYKNPGDDRMTRAEEFADSIDVPGNRFITPLWAPVGLRFHATHHLFPSMPYHNLGEARRRLIAQLEDNSTYLASTRKNLFVALAQLIRDARAHQNSKQETAAKDTEQAA
jgi:fatty acid desaturase